MASTWRRSLQKPCEHMYNLSHRKVNAVGVTRFFSLIPGNKRWPSFWTVVYCTLAAVPPEMDIPSSWYGSKASFYTQSQPNLLICVDHDCRVVSRYRHCTAYRIKILSSMQIRHILPPTTESNAREGMRQILITAWNNAMHISKCTGFLHRMQVPIPHPLAENIIWSLHMW